jgi:Ca-activated chloride channel family protein
MMDLPAPLGLLTQLDWRAPAWGLLLLIPLALAGLTWQRRHRLLAYAEAPLRPWAMSHSGDLSASPWRALAGWLAWLLLAVAAAGPRLPLEAALNANAPPRHPLTLLVALDLSASMAATDIAPDRLTRARMELTDLLKRLHGERVGLLVYAGQAGLLLPSTDDLALVENALAQATPDLIEQPGSHHAAALDLALSTLGAGPKNNTYRAVLLLTDGEADSLTGEAGVQAQAAAVRLKQAGIPLFILGLGNDTGAPIPLTEGGFIEHDGQQVVSTLARGPLNDLARSTGGRFAPVADGDGDWSSLYDSGIATLPGAPVAPERAQTWRELFMLPLAASLLLFMLTSLSRGTRRRLLPGLALMLAFIAHPGSNTQAADLESRQAPQKIARQAFEAYKSGRHGEALNLYVHLGGYGGHMGAGAAAWQLKDYTAATRHFSAALLLARTPGERTDALYNLGNAHYGLGRWAVAVEAFQAVLAARPDDPRARANLAQAENRLKKSRRDGPMRSDLKGRRGSIAEGQINLDWDRETAVQEFEPDPEPPLVDRDGQAAAGARLSGEAARARQVALDARRLESGLGKLPLLQDQPKAMLQGLLKQDRSTTGTPPELPPW